MRRKLRRFHKHYSTETQRQIRRFKALRLHPIMIPIVTFLVIGTVSLFGFLVLHQKPVIFSTNSKIVIISYDNTQQTVPTKEPTVGALLSELNIKINQGDVVEPSTTTAINQDDFRINIYRAVPVEIVDGGQTTYTFSAATTPRSIVQQQGITVYPEDYVTEAPVTNFVTAASVDPQVIIDPATPINLNIYGTPTVTRTHAQTVAALLKEKNIVLGAGDTIQPVVTTLLTPGIQVFLYHNGTQIQTVQQTIATPTQTIDDPSLSFGTSAVRQQGTPGQEVITYQVNLQNGVAISRSLIQTVVTQPPVTEIVVEGTNLSGIQGDMTLAGIAPSDYNYASYIISNESGWCPTKAQGEHYCPAIPDNSMTPNGYGLCQATPGYKMASAGADWATNPITQLRWCSGYAAGRYGSWYNAYIHWTNYRSW